MVGSRGVLPDAGEPAAKYRIRCLRDDPFNHHKLQIKWPELCKTQRRKWRERLRNDNDER
jgi:hypothetical protein